MCTDHKGTSGNEKPRRLEPFQTLRLSVRFVREVLPLVDLELGRRWIPRASAIPDRELRTQALASLEHKRFHCEGGSVYALLPEGARRDLVSAIVALQTISDYLDNLCDRSTSGDPADFRALHEAWLDAVSPEPSRGAYYRLHPESDDGGYLTVLVRECRSRIHTLPSYDAVSPALVRLALLYRELQVLKHQLPAEGREPALRAWIERTCYQPGLHWWETAAATGSTLGIFALLRAASRPGLGRPAVDALQSAYFPWIDGLHILLDYFIDQQEDIEGRDLNFIACYPGRDAATRLPLLVRRALAQAATLPEAPFHCWVVRGLPALYLADPKARRPELRRTSRRVLRASGVAGIALHYLVRACLLWRSRVRAGRMPMTTR